MQYQFLPISELAQEVGRQVREYRIRKGLEQAQVAEIADISERTVRALEQGGGSSLDTLLRVMKALGTLDGLDKLFPQALLKRSTPPRRVSRKRGPRG